MSRWSFEIAAGALTECCLGANSKASDLLRCPSAILFLVSAMFGAQEAEVFGEKTDLWRSQPS